MQTWTLPMWLSLTSAPLSSPEPSVLTFFLSRTQATVRGHPLYPPVEQGRSICLHFHGAKLIKIQGEGGKKENIQTT